MSAKPLAWSRTFDDPLLLPDGRMLRTPADAAAAGEGDPPAGAGHYAAALPEAVQQRTAAEMLITAAKAQRPVMFARIAMRQALHAGKPVLPSKPGRKPAHKYRIVR